MNAENLTDEQLRAILEERYNENHDPATGRFTSGRNAIGAMLKSGELIALNHHGIGGGGGVSSGGQDYEKNRADLQNAINTGKVKTKLEKNDQAKHKYGSEQYKESISKGELPSYTTLSNMEIQKIINENCCKGKVLQQGEQFKELITLNENFGMFGDRRTGTYIPTNRGTIHYSKRGTHLVPAPPEGE